MKVQQYTTLGFFVALIICVSQYADADNRFTTGVSYSQITENGFTGDDVWLPIKFTNYSSNYSLSLSSWYLTHSSYSQSSELGDVSISGYLYDVAYFPDWFSGIDVNASIKIPTTKVMPDSMDDSASTGQVDTALGITFYRLGFSVVWYGGFEYRLNGDSDTIIYPEELTISVGGVTSFYGEVDVGVFVDTIVYQESQDSLIQASIFSRVPLLSNLALTPHFLSTLSGESSTQSMGLNVELSWP